MLQREFDMAVVHDIRAFMRHSLNDYLLAIYRATRNLDDATDAALAAWPEERDRIDRAYLERVAETGDFDRD